MNRPAQTSRRLHGWSSQSFGGGVSGYRGGGGSLRSVGVSGKNRISSSSQTIAMSGFGGGGFGFGSGGSFSGSGSGSGVRLSTSMGLGSSLSGGFDNEKHTMQDLNDRLARYLEKVRSLEASNKEMELQIRQFYEQTSTTPQDYSSYWATIKSLQGQINDLILGNSGIMLQVDNSKLATEDFKNKYDYELCIRMSVENDINGLRTMLDNMTLDKSQLETQIENLKEELIYIRKNHEDMLKELRSQVSGNISVDVVSEDSVDLVKVLAEIRNKYEAIICKNRDEAEEWYKQQFMSMQQQAVVNTGVLEGEKNQLIQLRHTHQGLETELQSLLSMISSLEANLIDTDCRYDEERRKLEIIINGLEMELGAIRSRLQSQTEEYTKLLNINSILEQEIATYRMLLGGYGSQTSNQSMVQKGSNIVKTMVSKKAEPVVSTKQKKFTLVEEIVDGRVISSRMEEMKDES